MGESHRRDGFIRKAAWFVRSAHANVISRWIARGCSRRMSLGDGKVLVIAPHPDDETLGCGGMIAQKRAAGTAVRVVFLTSGGKSPSHLDSASFCATQYSAVRTAEARSALEVLGVQPEHIEFLEYADGGLDDLPECKRSELVRRLENILTKYQPVEVYVPHELDCHPDHEAAFELIGEAIGGSKIAVRLFQYMIWLSWLRPSALWIMFRGRNGGWRLNISEVRHKKIAAIQKYTSQTRNFPIGFLNRFMLPFEIFHEVAVTTTTD